MPEYVYRFADLLTDNDIAELELSNVKFDRRIIAPGAFSATAEVPNSDIASVVRKIVPGRTVVHVYRNANIWGTYIIWQSRVKSNSRRGISVDFSGSSLESFFHRRIIDVALQYTNLEQTHILQDLVFNAQSSYAPYSNSANLGMGCHTVDTGVLRTRKYLISEGATYGQRMEELANVDNGFEYYANVYWSDALQKRVKIFEVGYPHVGLDDSKLVYSMPGNLLSYEFSYDATDSATAFWTRGDTANSDVSAESHPLFYGPSWANLYLQNGWPILDKMVDYSSVTELSTLQNYADWWAANHAGVTMIPQFNVYFDDSLTPQPSLLLGSYADFSIEDVWFPLNSAGVPTYSGKYRIVGFEVSPPERGRNESVRFVIEQNIDPTDTGV